MVFKITTFSKLLWETFSIQLVLLHGTDRTRKTCEKKKEFSNNGLTVFTTFFSFFFLQSESSVDIGVGSAFRRIEKKKNHVYHNQSLHRSPGVASATVEMTTPAPGWRQCGMAKQTTLLQKGVPPKIPFSTLIANLSKLVFFFFFFFKESTGNLKQRKPATTRRQFRKRPETLEGIQVYSVDGVAPKTFLSTIKAKELTQGARLALMFFVVSDRSSIMRVTSGQLAASA